MTDARRKRKPAGWPADLPYPADRHAVKAALHRRGHTLSGLAKAHGYTASLCRTALYARKTIKGEEIIAAALGVPRNALFDRQFWARGAHPDVKRDAA